MTSSAPSTPPRPHLVAVLLDSYRHWTGRELLTRQGSILEEADAAFRADFVLAAHDGGEDPRFIYGNALALDLFGYDWETFTQLPSRLSAEPDGRAERSRLLDEVQTQGYANNYRGIRTGRHGRFEIEEAEVWNLIDAEGQIQGQAACFALWHWLGPSPTGPKPRQLKALRRI